MDTVPHQRLSRLLAKGTCILKHVFKLATSGYFALDVLFLNSYTSKYIVNLQPDHGQTDYVNE